MPRQTLPGDVAIGAKIKLTFAEQTALDAYAAQNRITRNVAVTHAVRRFVAKNVPAAAVKAYRALRNTNGSAAPKPPPPPRKKKHRK